MTAGLESPVRDTRRLLLNSDFPRVRRQALTTVQANLGYLCNMSCGHCHVNAGPNRSELMNREVARQVLDLCAFEEVEILDLTGGAPEMNPNFHYLVEGGSDLGLEVIDRCNLTILLQPGYEQLASFLARNRVVITASLPCYLEENVRRQRGRRAWPESIRALRLLNDLGYGEREELKLNLVYNPVGEFLPPPQGELEAEYKQELKKRYGIVFNRLYALANMPIARYGATLLAAGRFEPYMQLLKSSFNPDTLASLMCRSTVSVDWRGYLYDCDFHQALDLPMTRRRSSRLHISDLLADPDLAGGEIYAADHCYGCTAGQGSSCTGALRATHQGGLTAS